MPDVAAVVDTGLHKVARYDADRAIDSLESERISRDSADQRAGRAARLGPGVAVRLWDAARRLRPHREPEIAPDRSRPAVVLDVIAWGGDPRTLDWFEPPRADALDRGHRAASRLGAISTTGGLTPLGRRMRSLTDPPAARATSCSPRGGTRAAALGCAHAVGAPLPAARAAATTCDLLAAVDAERDLPPHVLRVAEDLMRSLERFCSVRLQPDQNGSGTGTGPPEGGRYERSHGPGTRTGPPEGGHHERFRQ